MMAAMTARDGTSKVNSQQVARAGEHFVAAELHRRGAYAVLFPGQHARIDMMASNTDQTKTVTVQVKTKGQSSQSWQTSTRRGDPLKPGTEEVHFWILVELRKGNAEPAYFIVPGDWMRKTIRKSHQKYLRLHGGARPNAPESTHYAIKKSAVEEWRDRWDLLGIF